ncbi:MAG TPA: hypothetical protein VEH04_17785 [Verrucomicrobiae bacterium]|nr:hypothetical protein [Verrucomicrobiae bacterium]
MKITFRFTASSFGLAAALFAMTAHGQGVFQASLATPPDGGAQLSTGRFWGRVSGNEMEFMAVLFQGFAGMSEGLAPALIADGTVVSFSLGQGTAAALHGGYTVADRNPFVPWTPPFQYDEDGNPYLIDNASIRYATIYSGTISLPDGFLEALMRGEGVVHLNDFYVGTIAAVPEPSTSVFVFIAATVFVVRKARGPRP